MKIDARELRTLVAKVAAATLLARHWAQGTRHDNALALAGALQHGHWTPGNVAQFVGAVVGAAADEENGDRIQAVIDTLNTNGKPTTGWPTLSESLSSAVVDRVRAWLGLDATGAYGLLMGGSLLAQTAPGSGWPEPQPFSNALPVVPPFPAEKLVPAPLLGWVDDIARHDRAPVEFSAVAVMVAAASVVGWRVGVMPQTQGRWVAPVNLWGVPIGDSATGKSPVIAAAMGPLWGFEERLAESYKQERAAWERRELFREEQRKVLQHQLKKAAQDGTPGDDIARLIQELDEPEPPLRRLVANDITQEKLADVLGSNPTGLLVQRDELIGLLRSLEKENQSHARAFYLECHSGTGRYVTERITRESKPIRNGCISLLGGMVPGPFGEYVRGALEGGAGDDGLLPRLQLALWPDPLPVTPVLDMPEDIEAAQRAYRALERLAFGDLSSFRTVASPGLASVPDDAVLCGFDADAWDFFREFRQDIEKRARAESQPVMASHLSKYIGLVPRLAMLGHLLENSGGPVPKVEVLRAAAWTDVLHAHARRIYFSSTRRISMAAERLADYLREGALVDGFTVRSVYRNGWTGLLTKAQAQEALNILLDHGYIRVRNQLSPNRHFGLY